MYHQLDDMSQLFHKYRGELHFENGLLFKDHRLVIPSELQNKLCKWLHAPHLGVEKTLARARLHYFWPNMSGQIKKIVSNCSVCEQFKRNIQKEPLTQEKSPEYPFQRISIDLYEYAGHDHVAIIDSYSGYLISEKLNRKTSGHIIEVLCKIFNRVGYPSEIKCDNSPFGSMEFEKFANDANILFKFSSPRYPQSNGLAEKGVAIAKNILKRCHEAHKLDDFQYHILEYNATPIASLQMSPAQLFFGRQIKTRLPITGSQLCRGNVSETVVQEKFEKKKERQKYYYDRTARSLPTLNVGDQVIFKKSGREWNYGKIVHNVNDKSYIVIDNFMNYFRRNRRFMSKTTNNEINPSELLLEDHIRNNINSENEAYTEIKIVPGKQRIVSNCPEVIEQPMNQHVSVERNGADRSADRSLESPTFYDARNHDSSQSSSESDSDTKCLDIPSPAAIPHRTRSGRVSRPVDRYGDWVPK